MKPTFIDLFSGAGGWSLGLRWAGFVDAGHYELNASACRTAAANFAPEHVHCVDLREHKAIKFPEVDLVAGSPPCQGFSNEGKKRRDDQRNDLVWAFFDIVERIRPTAWVFENVPGFKGSYCGHFYSLLRERLEKLDYQWSDFVLDASNYGVPQYRRRFIAMGSLKVAPASPSPSHSDEPSLFGELAKVSLWDSISDLPQPTLGDRIGHFNYSAPAVNLYQEWSRNGSSHIENHTAQNHSERVLEKIKAVPVGGNMKHIVDSFEENRTHYEGGYRRAVKDKPSYTAYWTRGMTSIHPEQHRFLTPRECARIQSFPDSFVFHGATIENYTQICNAVPPLLALAIGKQLHRQCFSHSQRPAAGGFGTTS
ncbi:MAG TPA: DNA cytosine methyltransferase [Phycisphaerae bacterium]|nr:DNA cytosine methyltransferase [Phycisphaerae bacterium]